MESQTCSHIVFYLLSGVCTRKFLYYTDFILHKHFSSINRLDDRIKRLINNIIQLINGVTRLINGCGGPTGAPGGGGPGSPAGPPAMK